MMILPRNAIAALQAQPVSRQRAVGRAGARSSSGADDRRRCRSVPGNHENSNDQPQNSPAVEQSGPRGSRSAVLEAPASEAPGGKRHWLRNPLDAEIASIAIPMLATLAVEPCAALINTGFLGRMGAAQLAGVGVALSVYNTCTKLLQVPLLSVATTTVAAAKGAQQQHQQQLQQQRQEQEGGGLQEQQQQHQQQREDEDHGGEVSAAASAALAVAVVVGIAIAAALFIGRFALAGAWGLTPQSPLWQPALDFLTLRALGAPISVVLLVVQGCFRGLQDTRTPLSATLAVNVLNIGLDYCLIFVVGLGVKGAAVATILAQLLPCVWLLGQLRRSCTLKFADGATLKRLVGLLGPTVFLAVRSAAIAGSFAVATSLSARWGPQAAAAHQVCTQLWMASSLLSDALAVAAQSLVARSLAAGQPAAARQAAERSVQLAIALGFGMALGLAAAAGFLPSLFTPDPATLTLAGGIWLWVVASQPLSAAAFAWDGVLLAMQREGPRYACVQMVAACGPAVAFMLWATGHVDGGASAALAAVWAGLTAIMGMRALLIWAPYRARTGPFRALFADVRSTKAL